MKHEKGLMLIGIIFALGIILFGCTKPPDAEKQAAKAAMDAAIVAGADKYAVADLDAAKKVWNTAESQVNEKKYKEAKQSYIDAKAAFEKAAGSVEAGKADASKADYEKVQKIQDANEQIIQRTADYDIKMKACDDSINSLQDFLEKHKEGEWNKLAKNALQSWESRKTAYEREINSLTEQLFTLLRKRAVQESEKTHKGSKIETINLDTRDKGKDGNNINVKDSYSVRMRGTLAGVHIFKLTVKVKGHIAMDSKSVLVDSALVEE